MKNTILLTSALAMAAFARPALAADVFGLWLTESQNAIVSIQPCGNSACGSVVWLAAPLTETGAKKTDRKNPDAALQSREICGMPMIGDFERDGDGWTGGFIYNPEEGKTYSSNMRLTDEGNLYVRGYVGISLLGKSQTWTPVPDNRGGC